MITRLSSRAGFRCKGTTPEKPKTNICFALLILGISAINKNYYQCLGIYKHVNFLKSPHIYMGSKKII